MNNEILDENLLAKYYKKRKLVVAIILLFSLLFAGTGFYMMSYQLLGSGALDPAYYSRTSFEHVFASDLSVYPISNHIYYITAAFYGECVISFFALISLVVILLKKRPNLDYSHQERVIKREKIRSLIVLVFATLVALYCGTTFILSRIILIDDGNGITYVAGLVGGFFAASGIFYAVADFVYSKTLIHIYSNNRVEHKKEEGETFAIPFEERKTIPSSVFDELTSDIPVETKTEVVEENDIKYIEKTDEEPVLINETEEDIQPMAYVPLEYSNSNVVKETPKPVEKPVFEPKPEPKPEPKVEPKKEPKPEPKPEPKKESPKVEETKQEVEEDDVNEEKFTLKEILKNAATISETPTVGSKPKVKLTKNVISKTLKTDYPKVEQKRRENYTTTGLPLADTHYVSTPKGKKCFMYVYETTGNPLLLIKIPNYYYRQLKERGFVINKSQFPKSKLSWSSLVLDSKVDIEDVKEAINIASEFVKTNS